MGFGVTPQCLFSKAVNQGFDTAVKALNAVLVQLEEKERNEKAFTVKSHCTLHVLL